MIKAYFDNAATTPLDPHVIEVMHEILSQHYGNASSIHAPGRKARSIIEEARKIVAKEIKASVGEVFFTGSATESNNTILHGAVKDLGVKTIITSPIEHDCILQRTEVERNAGCDVKMIEVDHQGRLNLSLLEREIEDAKMRGDVLVSLMHANNEIGTIFPIDEIGSICKKHEAFFHTDTVQSMGKLEIDVQKMNVHFLSSSAHKFHGPKGVGFFYMRSDAMIKPMIVGGAQERNMRSGTENVAGIAGLAKALQIYSANRAAYCNKLLELRDYFESQILDKIPVVSINGYNNPDRMPHISSVSFPGTDKADLLVLNLDIKGVCVSSGSACSAGIEQDSHVLQAIGHDHQRKTIRFSFSHFNTKEEIDYTIDTLKSLM